ncbi:MAG: glycosyltransferase family 39 protein [Patescibacteria group bacterium]
MKYLSLFLILIFAFILRTYGLNWDQGFYMHPDERAIVMFTIPLQFPNTISEFLSPTSSWNPHFFAYGNFPLYLLKIVSLIAGNFDPSFALYDKINIVGRFISGIFDLGTIFFVFLLGKKLFNKKVGILASFFYTISVFPIQASHFYAVDTPLTFFILLTLYQLIRLYEKPSLKNSIFVGMCFGVSLVTKISAIPLITAIIAAIAVDFLLLVAKQPHKPRVWLPHIPRFLKRFIFDGIAIIISTVIIFIVLQPYSIIDFPTFWRQNMEQSQMTHDAFTFPYTLQYVGKIPYLYEVKNIFLWGQGPILATISFIGILYTFFVILKKKKERKWAQELVLLIFFLSYFAIVGKFAVGWMRYMLPLYPLLCLFGAVFVSRFLIPKMYLFPRYLSFLIFNFSFLILLVWPLSFMNIYTKPNTRILASQWINQNIPVGSTLAIEHWDDSLPLLEQQNYKMITLSLYDPDTSAKWDLVNQQLSQTDYIIIASNRLYTPLMKLTDCKKLPVGRCYAQTAEYYKKLFDGSLGFEKVAEFKSYPKLSFPLVKWEHEINDSTADESFTVYDHPKVIIFKKIP